MSRMKDFAEKLAVFLTKDAEIKEDILEQGQFVLDLCERYNLRVELTEDQLILSRRSAKMLAAQLIINYYWFLEYEFVGDKVRILAHYRLHNRRDQDRLPENLDDLPEFQLREKEGRIVEKAIIDDKTYDVENPAYVFNYRSSP